jgi:hypothetical protein
MPAIDGCQRLFNSQGTCMIDGKIRLPLIASHKKECGSIKTAFEARHRMVEHCRTLQRQHKFGALRKRWERPAIGMTTIKPLTLNTGNGLRVHTESLLARPGQQPAQKVFACSSVCRLSLGRDIHSRMIFRRCSCSGFNFKSLL